MQQQACYNCPTSISNREPQKMLLRFTRTNGEIDTLIDELLEKAGGIYHPNVAREIILSALKAGQDTDYLADL